VRRPPAHVEPVAAVAEVDAVLRRRARVIEQPVEQVDVGVLLLHQPLPEGVRKRQRAERAQGVDEERVRAIERVDVAAVGQLRPAPRLDRAAHLQRQLVVAHLPLGRLEAPFAGEPPQVAVGTDVVEAVIVDADVGEMRRHPLEGAGAAQIEELLVAGGVELQQRRAELEALRPLRPAAGAVLSFDGEHRRPVLGAPGVLDGVDFRRGQLEQSGNLRQQLRGRARPIDEHQIDVRLSTIEPAITR
jgi:hypothetical protein